jgi:Rps23 Pro-64 3,4-dihydroxylase Tpa1-like proline 4-hydroxylase
MNSTPIHPNDLINEGAYIGNIMDFINDSEYNEIISVIKKVKEFSIAYRDTELYCRYTINNALENYKDKIHLSEVEARDLYVKENNLNIWQKWYEFLGADTLKDKSNYIFLFDIICKRILNYFYPNYEIDYNTNGSFTLYENGHFIENHRDGNDNNFNRMCVIIIYISLESEYNNNGGGELVIKTNSQKEYTIKPILGTFSLLDFSKNNVYHAVNMVKNDFKRYAFINFFDTKNWQILSKNKKTII